MSWNALSPEIRCMIMDHILEICHPWPSNNPIHSQLPLVSREWYRYFNHDNFRLIVLDQDRLDDFREIINTSRMKFVDRIILRIKLPAYSCHVCETAEDEYTAALNDSIFTSTLARFMHMISAWDAQTLDLGVYSPSDGQHTFRECRSSMEYRYGASHDVYDRHSNNIRQAKQQAESTVPCPSICPGWKRVCRDPSSQPAYGSKRRTFATIQAGRRGSFRSQFRAPLSDPFPPAPVITSLVLRRHYHRHISPVILGRLIYESLPNLRSFRHEVPIHPSMFDMTVFWERYYDVLESLPSTLDHFSLYQESEKLLRLHENPQMNRNATWVHPVDRGQAQDFTARVHQLKSFHSTTAIDAREFSRYAYDLNLEFPKLERMVLTSEDLQRRVPVHELADLIHELGFIAFAKMPRLESLILWEGKINDGFFMRFYLSCDGNPAVDFYSTHYSTEEIWHIIQGLDEVLSMDEPYRPVVFHPLQSNPAHVPEVGYPTNFEGVQDVIMDPESLRQMRFEAKQLGIN